MRDNKIWVWNTESGNRLCCLRGHTSTIESIAFSPDGKRIVSGSFDKTVRVWDVENGAQLTCLRGHEGRVGTVAFLPDGKHIVSEGEPTSDGWGVFTSDKVWNVESENLLHYLHGHEASILRMAVSPGGRRIVTGSGSVHSGVKGDTTIRVWNVENGSQLHRLDRHKGQVRGLAFSPDGERFASKLTDGTIRLCNVQSGEDLEFIKGVGDLAAIAAGAPKYPWRAISRGLETVIELTEADEIVALLPVAFSHISTHPSGRIWAGASGNHLCIFQLEGGNKQPG